MLYDIESKALKIIDFGTAAKFKAGEKLSNLVGTPYYIAP
jgi:serine/threonine protein kinase